MAIYAIHIILDVYAWVHYTETHAAVMDSTDIVNYVMSKLSWVIYICLGFPQVRFPLKSVGHWHLKTTPFSLLPPSSI